MSQTLDLRVRLSLAGPLRPNAEVEVRLLIGHMMETGFRYDGSGAHVAKDILQFVKVHMGDALIFEAELPQPSADSFGGRFCCGGCSGRTQ